jgi:hypothetical protein
MKTTARAGKRLLVAGAVTLGALFAIMAFSGGCKKQETASEKAGREAREAFEKGKDLLKEGLDKTKDLTKEGLEKGSEAAKEGIEKSQEAAKGFAKGWKEGGK